MRVNPTPATSISNNSTSKITAQIRRDRFALNNNCSKNSDSAILSSISSKNSLTGAAPNSFSKLFHQNRGNYSRMNSLFYSPQSHRFKEMDVEKMLTAMEKGHKVCKLLLLKKWDPSYKKLSFNRDTRQIILSKFENISSSKGCSNSAASSTTISSSSKKQILDLRLVKEVQILHYKLNSIKITDKWKKDKDVQRFDSEMILVINYGSSFVFNHWILLCK